MRDRLATIVGLAALWLCCQTDIYFPLSFVHTAEDPRPYAEVAAFHALYCLLVLVLLGTAWLRCSRVQQTLSLHSSLMAKIELGCGAGAAALFVLGRCAHNGGGLLTFSHGLLLGTGVLLAALWFVMTLPSWFKVLTIYPRRQLFANLLWSFATYLAVYSIMSIFNISSEIYLVFCPLLSSGGALMALRNKPQSQAETNPADRSLKAIPWATVIPLTLLIICLASGVRLMSSDPAASARSSILFTVACSLLIFASVAIVLLLRPWGGETRMLVFTMLAGLAMLGLVLAVALDNRGLSFSPRRFIVAVQHCMEFFVFLVLADTLSARKVSLVLTSVVFGYAITVPRLVASDLMHLVGDAIDTGISQNPATPLVTALFVFVITVGSLVVLVLGRPFSSDANAYKPISNVSAPNAIDPTRIVRLVQVYGLSERELQTAACIGSGFSQKATAEVLCVAESTVKTHCKHIYAKLGIHTRTELETLVTEYDTRPIDATTHI